MSEQPMSEQLMTEQDPYRVADTTVGRLEQFYRVLCELEERAALPEASPPDVDDASSEASPTMPRTATVETQSTGRSEPALAVRSLDTGEVMALLLQHGLYADMAATVVERADGTAITVDDALDVPSRVVRAALVPFVLEYGALMIVYGASDVDSVSVEEADQEPAE